MSLKLGPELQVVVNKLKCLHVVLGQPQFLPELVGQVGTLNRLHVEVDVALVLAHGCVARIRQVTAMAGAEPRQVELIAAESLHHRPTLKQGSNGQTRLTLP